MSVLRKEMEKYRDIDEDELLKKLSEEELQRLEDELEELDPDVSLEFTFYFSPLWVYVRRVLDEFYRPVTCKLYSIHSSMGDLWVSIAPKSRTFVSFQFFPALSVWADANVDARVKRL